MKASESLDEARHLATLVHVSERSHGRMRRNELGVRSEDDDLDVVPHALEDLGGIEQNRPALALPVDPDEAQAER